MTADELKKAAKEYSDNAQLQSNYPHHEQSSYDGFLVGAKFANKHWQEKTKFKLVKDFKPPLHKEVLVKSPDGLVRISTWRDAYNIFDCQNKYESSDNWGWKEIE